MNQKILQECQNIIPSWALYNFDDFIFEDPKGFSSFTIGVHCKKDVTPKSVLYRKLEGKENAILDHDLEKNVFTTLGKFDIAVDLYHYSEKSRIEHFVHGRSLTPEDLHNPEYLKQIANRLYTIHQIKVHDLPQQTFFELLHCKWGALARSVLENYSSSFPLNEQEMCLELKEIYSDATREKVNNCLPKGELTFCHNDTYHGNIMKLNSGEIKLFDFEFSCLNFKCYDFSNLFAETVMKHKQKEYPFFKIDPPDFGDEELGVLINFYLDNEVFGSEEERENEFQKLLRDTKDMLILSDYKYALAAIPLSLAPQQKISFIPYAYQRFSKFLKAYKDRFEEL